MVHVSIYANDVALKCLSAYRSFDPHQIIARLSMIRSTSICTCTCIMDAQERREARLNRRRERERRNRALKSARKRSTAGEAESKVQSSALQAAQSTAKREEALQRRRECGFRAEFTYVHIHIRLYGRICAAMSNIRILAQARPTMPAFL